MKKDYSQYDHPRNDCYWLKRGYSQEDIPLARKEYNKRYGHPISEEQRELISSKNRQSDSPFQKMMKDRWADPDFREKIKQSDTNSWKNGKRDRRNTSSLFTVEYWMSKGMTEEEAKEYLANRNRRNLEYFIEKYGKDERRDTFQSDEREASKFLE